MRISDWSSDVCSSDRAAERRARLAAAQERMTEIGAAALLVNAGPSLRYFNGVAWAPSERLVAMLLPAAGEPRIICPTFEQGSLVAEHAIDAELLLWEEDERSEEQTYELQSLMRNSFAVF